MIGTKGRVLELEDVSNKCCRKRIFSAVLLPMFAAAAISSGVSSVGSFKALRLMVATGGGVVDIGDRRGESTGVRRGLLVLGKPGKPVRAGET